MSDTPATTEAPVTFDLEKVYDDEINPLMAQIIAICQRVNMPMIASFNYKKGEPDDASQCSYCTTRVPGIEHPPEFKEAVHLIRNGASTRPKMFAMTITGTSAK